MAKLKITRANGEVSEHKITPGVEYAFELKYGSGISKVLREHERKQRFSGLLMNAYAGLALRYLYLELSLLTLRYCRGIRRRKKIMSGIQSFTASLS
jgi:hypothetical protein